MEVIYDEATLKEYVAKAVGVTPDRPLLIDRFLKNALECEADALADSRHVYIPAVMEHVELAGIHSGDSTCVIPPVNIPAEEPSDNQGVHQEDCGIAPCVRSDEHAVRD